jgi:hypothetical protein
MQHFIKRRLVRTNVPSDFIAYFEAPAKRVRD